MCPSFLPLPASPDGGKWSGKYLQLFIAHNKGCQYYIGTYNKDGMYSSRDPRAHDVGRQHVLCTRSLDRRESRQIMWAWLLDNPGNDRRELQQGWSGVYGLPRGVVARWRWNLAPIRSPEFTTLRFNGKMFPPRALGNGASWELECTNGTSCEIVLTIKPGKWKKAGVVARASRDGCEKRACTWMPWKNCLVFDSRASSKAGTGRPAIEKAPFRMEPGETISLRIFIDQCVIDMFVNDRQAITRRVYPSSDDSTGVHIFCEGAMRNSRT